MVSVQSFPTDGRMQKKRHEQSRARRSEALEDLLENQPGDYRVKPSAVSMPPL